MVRLRLVQPPRRSLSLVSGLVLGVVVCLAGGWLAAPGREDTGTGRSTAPPAGADHATVVAGPRLPVEQAGVPQPRVLTAELNHAGEPVYVACSTCHATRAANFTNGVEQLPAEFHQGLQYRHGGQSCLSCHNADDYDTLRRADGRALGYDRALTLCAQCHGPQTRDYRHGSHGGMVGYWDLGKGERERNRCIDCHDPHAPAYPQMTPIFPPRDRGAREQAARAAAHSAAETSSHD